MKSTTINRFLCGFTSLALAALIGSSSASAQDYKSDPIKAEFVLPNVDEYDIRDKTQRMEYNSKRSAARKALTNVQSISKKVIKGTEALGARTAEFDQFFKEWYIPVMTQTDDDSLSALGDLRETLFKSYIRDANGPARTRLIRDILFPAMTRIVEDEEYHPAVRSNAMIIISLLNDTEGERDVRLPTPSAAAVSYMTAALDNAALPGYLRLIAMGGLFDHAAMSQNSLDQTTRNSLETKMLDILAKTEPKDDKELSAEEYWSRRRAVQLLGALGNPASAPAVLKVMNDDKSSLWLKCGAVVAYGKLNLRNMSNAEIDSSTQSIAKVVSDALKSDSQFITDYIYSIKEKEMLATIAKEMRSGSGPGGKGGAGKGAGKSRGDVEDEAPPDPSGRGGGLGGKGMAALDPNESEENTDPTKSESGVKFPVYKINLIKQRVKTVAYAARVALGGERMKAGRTAANKGLSDATTDEDKLKMLTELVGELDGISDEIEFPEKRRGRGADDLVDGQTKKALVDRIKKLLDDAAVDIEKIAKITPSPPTEATPITEPATTEPATDSADASTEDSKTEGTSPVGSSG